MSKTKSFSHIEAQDRLECLNESRPSGEELVYDLLRIFCGYGDGQTRRIREGVGNKAKDGRTVVVPKVIAYRPKGSLDFHDEIKQMQADPKITKHAPRLYVVSDGQMIVAVDPMEQEIYENKVALMWKDFDFFYPLAGIEKFRNMEEAEADVKSAELMAKIYDEIRRHNDIKDKTEMHNLNVFMSRLLFCFFAEDTNLFPESNLFTNSIRKYTADDGHDLAEFIERAFLAMSVEDRASLEIPNIYSVFPYVNGGLFKQHVPIPTLSRRARMLMLKCGDYDWKEINPDIFGSMIQAVVTPEMRAGLGMHYTSVPNIMKLIQPLFLDELHEAYRKAAEERNVKKLQELLSRMSKIKFFDPACGSGNFLIISYKRIRELEIQIWQAIADISRHPVLPFSQIALTQFYGIEIDEYACDTAKLSLWLAEHQMNNKFYEALNIRPQALPLRASGNIVSGNACRMDWNSVCPHTADEEVYIMGNPPYLGSALQDTSQKEDMKIAISKWCKGYKKLDYICTWFIKAAKFIKKTSSKAAFVSTNSICQGEIVEPLWSTIFDNNIVIDFAITSFRWSNSAKHNAAVYCIIVGLSINNKNSRRLYSNNYKTTVSNISPYLITGDNSIVTKQKSSISFFPEIIRGCMPYDGGNLLMTPEIRNHFILQYPNLQNLIKRIYSADDFINGGERYCLWISDDDYTSLKDNNLFLNERFAKTAQMRLKSPDKSAKQLAARPYQFREFNACNDTTLIIPSTTSSNRLYIPVAFADNNTIVTNAMYMVYNASNWLLGVLSSHMNMLWIKTVGGRLKMDYRYTSLCYNSFPFPKINEIQKVELDDLAQNVLDIREEHFDMTLGEMYNPESMPNDLREAHHRLDLAVERCYRSEPFASDEERLEYLFKLYVKMTKLKV